jgi:hypothetical protein
MRVGQDLAMMLHLIGAEQLRPQRRLDGDVFLRRAVYAQARSQTEQAPANGLAAQFHLLEPLDLLNHILSSQLSRARFGLLLFMSFIDAFNVAFAVSIFVAQHYLQFPFLK